MNRIGEVNANRKGQRFIIGEYRSSNEVVIVFEEDNSKKIVTYQQFKNGFVRKTGEGEELSWVGEIIEDRYGEECTITEYYTDKDVTVQYPDGDIIAGLTLDEVMLSDFSRSDINNGIINHAEDIELQSKIDAERTRTYENVVYIVNRFRRCVMIRPCAFGKTKIGLRLFSSPRYKKCLFLYPTSDDRNAKIVNDSKSKKRIDTKTYAWLRGRTPEQIKALDYDIVFCDEVHCIGGNDDGDGAYQTYKAMKLLMESHPQTHFVGATATPMRMDGIPVISTMFHNHTCYPYTDEDAFEDGILQRPNYYYCVYDVRKKIRDEIQKSVNIGMSKDEMQKALQITDEDVNEIDTKYMDKHIKTSLSELFPDKNYFRFIAFYLTNELITENKDKVINWFKKAYPEYEVEGIVVTNKSRKTKEDVDKLPTKPSSNKYKGRIDIIFSCEMLTMDYHSEFLTGLIFDRKTQSFTKYIQMMGRVLRCESKNPVIIFDIADNIHSDFIFKTVKIDDDGGPVVPAFDKTPMTFDEILAAHPRARHWDEIKKTNVKARKSERMITNNEAKKTGGRPKPAVKDNAAKTYPFDGSPYTKELIAKAWELAERTGISFNNACNILSGIKDEYGPMDPCQCEEIEPPEKAIKESAKSRTAKDPVDKENASQTENRSQAAPSEAETDDEDDPLGFPQNEYHYNSDTRELYSKNVKVLNKKSNFEEDIKAAIRAVTKSALDNIIKKWHTYPTCEENYKSYEETDTKSSKYKFLKGCSEYVYGVPVEKVLLYMIEGKIV